MSTWSVRELPCPTCGATVRAQIALGAHVGRAPHVRDQILARTFHRFTCACGATIAVDAPFEYTDIERRQLVLVGTRAELPRWREREAYLQGKLRGLLELGSPLAQPFVHEVVARLVFGLDELREKLVIWDAAADDALIECVKVRAFAASPELAAPGARLFVDAIADDNAITCLWFLDPAGPPQREVTLPAPWLGEAIRDRASLAARFPELFAGGFVSVDRVRLG